MKAPDGTMGLYFKGKEIVPTGKYEMVSVSYHVNPLEDYYPFIRTEISNLPDNIGRYFACGALTIDGEEIIPLLVDCYIEHRNGVFKIFHYPKDNNEYLYLTKSERDAYYEEHLETYSKYKHARYEIDLAKLGRSSTNSSQATAPQSSGPHQVWVPCMNCLNSGQCPYCYGQGYQVTYSGTIDCPVCTDGHCTMCAGQGGHYEMQY